MRSVKHFVAALALLVALVALTACRGESAVRFEIPDLVKLEVDPIKCTENVVGGVTDALGVTPPPAAATAAPPAK
jgi:hypothetical protein